MVSGASLRVPDLRNVLFDLSKKVRTRDVARYSRRGALAHARLQAAHAMGSRYEDGARTHAAQLIHLALFMAALPYWGNTRDPLLAAHGASVRICRVFCSDVCLAIRQYREIQIAKVARFPAPPHRHRSIARIGRERLGDWAPK